MRRNGGGTNWGKYRSPSIASPKLRISARSVGAGRVCCASHRASRLRPIFLKAVFGSPFRRMLRGGVVLSRRRI